MLINLAHTIKKGYDVRKKPKVSKSSRKTHINELKLNVVNILKL